MKNVAIGGVIAIGSIAASITIALSASFMVAQNLRAVQLSACERGNVVRESLTTTASIIQSNLRAASQVDSTTAQVTYSRNIERLANVIVENASIDCETVVDNPSFLP